MSIKKTSGLLITLLFFLLAAPEFSPLAASASETDVLALLEERERAVAELMESSTLYVLLENGDSFSMGSAFIVAEGYAVTNAHVVGSAKRVLVMNSRLRPVMATVVRKEHDGETGGNDFALLKFSSATKLFPLTFTLRVNRMDRVSAWGFPVMVTQFDQSFDDIIEGKRTKAPPVVYTEGTVSAVVERQGQKTVIHSAAIAGGNSGGPLVNARGEVVGINTWGYTAEDEGAFVNASLPSERIVEFLTKAGIPLRMSRQSQELARTPLPVLSLPPQEPKKPSLSSPPSSSPTGNEERNKELLSLAKAGDPDAQAGLGGMYYDGDGFSQDTKLAVQWLEKSAKEGSEAGKALLGVLLVFEEEVADPKKGVRLLREAASAPDAEGWARRAADQGNEFGWFVLGSLYMRGEAVKKDPAMAWAYLSLAAERSVADADKRLEELEATISARDKKRAQDLQKQWWKEWGLSR